MESNPSKDPHARLLHKISILSKALGEIDDWLESGGAGAHDRARNLGKGPITLENLDARIALEPSERAAGERRPG
jgi:hypothetical protein